MKLPKITKKKFIGAALAAGLAMGTSGIAFAFFSVQATGKGDADVGAYSVTTAGVLVTHTNTGANENLNYPGTGPVAQTFVIYNGGSKSFRVWKATASVTQTSTSNHWIYTATTDTAVTGCHAVWFTVHVNHTAGTTSAVGVTIATGATHNQVVTVTMVTSGTTQNACQTKQPRVTLTVTVANH